MKKRQAGEPKRFRIRTLFLGLLVVLGVGFAIFRIGAYRDLQRRLAELSEAGYPLTMAELEQTYTVDPARDNAADYYLGALSHYRGPDAQAKEVLPKVGKAKLPARTEPLDPAMLQVIEAFLVENEEALSLLHEATALDYSRYPMDFSQGFDMFAPWLGSVREAAFLLSLEGLAACDRGDSNRAVESVHATLALAKSLNCVELKNRIVQIAIQVLAYGNTERIVNRMTLTDEKLRLLATWVETCVEPDGYRQAVLGERCCGLRLSRSTASEQAAYLGADEFVFKALVPLKILGLYDREMLNYVNVMQDCIEALGLPLDECRMAYETIGRQFSSGQRSGFVTKVFIPALLRTFELDVRNAAHRRVTLTALAIERFRLAQGRLPKTLGELVPVHLEAVPIDPFDNQPLRYRLLEKGFVVYSIGEDESDDGGAERDRDSYHLGGEPKWDITFFVER